MIGGSGAESGGNWDEALDAPLSPADGLGAVETGGEWKAPYDGVGGVESPAEPTVAETWNDGSPPAVNEAWRDDSVGASAADGGTGKTDEAPGDANADVERTRTDGDAESGGSGGRGSGGGAGGGLHPGSADGAEGADAELRFVRTQFANSADEVTQVYPDGYQAARDDRFDTAYRDVENVPVSHFRRDNPDSPHELTSKWITPEADLRQASAAEAADALALFSIPDERVEGVYSGDRVRESVAAANSEGAGGAVQWEMISGRFEDRTHTRLGGEATSQGDGGDGSREAAGNESQAADGGLGAGAAPDAAGLDVSAALEAPAATDAPVASEAREPTVEPTGETPLDIMSEPPVVRPGAEVAEARAATGNLDAQVVEKATEPGGVERAIEEKLGKPFSTVQEVVPIPALSEVVRPVRTGSEMEMNADMAQNRDRVEGAVAQSARQAETQLAYETAARQQQDAFDETRRTDAAALERKKTDEQAFAEKTASEQKTFEDARLAEQQVFARKQASDQAFAEKTAADQKVFDEAKTAEEKVFERKQADDQAFTEKAAADRKAPQEREAEERAALERARLSRPRFPGGPSL